MEKKIYIYIGNNVKRVRVFLYRLSALKYNIRLAEVNRENCNVTRISMSRSRRMFIDPDSRDQEVGKIAPLNRCLMKEIVRDIHIYIARDHTICVIGDTRRTLRFD